MNEEIIKLQQEIGLYKSRLEVIEEKLSALDDERFELERQIRERVNKIKMLKAAPAVTDHAIVRYFERVKGFDIEQIRNIIMPESVKQQIRVLGNCSIPAENYVLRVKNNRIVTIVPADD